MLNNLRKPYGKRKPKIVGRGRGSGHGKTSGRGHKGANARASGGTRPGFEGGQMPLIRRVPKRGFTFTPKEKFQVVSLERLNNFASGAQVNPDALQKASIVKIGRRPIKILGDGSLKHPLKIQAHAFSKSALEKIKSAGGTAETLVKTKKEDKVVAKKASAK
jgi:large subunit ribosomal protein L15